MTAAAPAPPSAGRRALALALLAGALAAALVAFGTARRGPARFPDAVAYLGAATSLAHGEGFRYPVAAWDAPDSTTALAHWPPGMSVAAAVPTAFGAGPVAAARAVLVAAAFATAAIVVGLLLRAAGGEAAAIGLMLLVTTPALTRVHLVTLSEPLFLACLAAQLALMVLRPRAALAYGAAAALAALTRYAGVALGAVAVAWAFAQPGRVRDRTRRAALAGLPSAVLVAAWLARLRLVGHGTRELVPPMQHRGWWEPLRQGAETLGYWLAPFAVDWRTVIAGGLVMLVLVAIATRVAWRRLRAAESRAELARRLMVAASLAAAALVAIVLASRYAADPYIELDERMLSPVVLAGTLALAPVIATVRHAAPPRVRLGTTVVLAVWLCFAGARTLEFGARVAVARPNALYEPAIGAKLLPWIATTGRGYALYTNNPHAVYFRAGRASHELPFAWSPATDSAFVRRLAAGPGALVGFEVAQTVVPRPTTGGREVERLAARLGLCRVVDDGPEGLWVAPSDRACTASAPPTTPRAARDSAGRATP